MNYSLIFDTINNRIKSLINNKKISTYYFYDKNTSTEMITKKLWFTIPYINNISDKSKTTKDLDSHFFFRVNKL